MLKLFLFGTPRCQQDGHTVHLPRRKCLALLAYLALNPQPHGREALATLLYPDSARALTYLRRTLSEIRQNLGDDLLLAQGEVQLARNELWVDVLEFEKLVKVRDGRLADNQLPVTSLQSAVSLYTANFMTGFTLPDAPAYDEWQFFQAESLRQTLATTLQKLIAWHASRREFERSIEYGRRWLALDPLHEPAHRELMQLYAASGQQAAALRQHEECARLLHEELGIVPAEETKALYETIRTRQSMVDEKSSPPLYSPAPPHNFPPQSTSFVGRQEEMAAIGRLLGDDPNCRLLTIVGQGGIGKTRLALEVGQQLWPTFTHGAYFVPLAPVSQADNLAQAIGAALNLQFSGRKSPHEQLLDILQSQHLLLILDNFEHLLTGVDLLSDILSTAPQVKLLITSRERLNTQTEWAYDLAGLTYPQQSTAPESIDDLLAAYSAPALFVQRAQQARVAFKPTPQNWPAIVHICQLVEGMPLGLELAASWIPIMSCQEVAAGIARNLDFLTTTLQDVPDRHRSLRAVFQHSWSLLTTDEQAVLSQLSVFRGGFTREAAEQITGTKLLPLASLVRKSLVALGGSGRYTVHELLRQFAAEKLAESPEAVATTQQAHAAYFAGFLQEREADLWADRQLDALNEIAADLDNVRQSWQWAVDRQDVTLLNQSATTLFFFYDMRGHIQEGERVFRLAVQTLTETASTSAQRLCLGKLLMGQGWFAVWAASFITGEACLKQATAWLRSVEPPALTDLSLTLNYLGLIRYFRGEVISGEELLQESLVLARAAHSEALVGRSLFNLGQTAILLGEYRQAEPYLEEASRRLAAIGEQHRRSMVLGRSGEMAQGMGDYARVESYFQESLLIRQQLDDRIRLPSTIKELGLLAYRRGDYDKAETMVRESLAMNQQTGNLYQIGEDHEALGLVNMARGNLALADTHLHKSLGIFREMGIHNRQPEVLNALARLALGRGAYDQARQFLSEALVLSQDNGNVAHKAEALQLWGEVKLQGGALQEAAQYFDEALEIANRIGAAPRALETCLSATSLFLPPHQDNLQRAGTFLQLALNHPAADQQTQDRARALLANFPVGASMPIMEEEVDLWTAVAELRASLRMI